MQTKTKKMVQVEAQSNEIGQLLGENICASIIKGANNLMSRRWCVFKDASEFSQDLFANLFCKG